MELISWGHGEREKKSVLVLCSERFLAGPSGLCNGAKSERVLEIEGGSISVSFTVGVTVTVLVRAFFFSWYCSKLLCP